MPLTGTMPDFAHDEALLEELLLVYQKAVRVTRTDEAAQTVLTCYTNVRVAQMHEQWDRELLSTGWDPENG